MDRTSIAPRVPLPGFLGFFLSLGIDFPVPPQPPKRAVVPLAEEPRAGMGRRVPELKTGQCRDHSTRESQSRDLKDWSGGTVIVVFGTGVLLVLAVILLFLIIN